MTEADVAGTAPADLLARHRAVLPTWLTLYYEQPLEIVSGSGRRVTGADGREYLDFFGGILTNMLGYDVPEVRAAVDEVLDRGVVHTSTLYLIRGPGGAGRADRRAVRDPGREGLLHLLRHRGERDGAAAGHPGAPVRAGAGAAQQLPRPVVRRDGHHRHPRLVGVGAVAGAGLLRPRGLPLPLAVARTLSDADYTAACVADLRDVIETTTAGDVACLIAEPIQGVGGFAVPPDGFFGAMKAVLDEYGILLVFDEVQSGWGRTGEHFWGTGAHGVTPDIMTFAKGVGNGWRSAGWSPAASLMDGLQANSISTFGGNPVATAARPCHPGLPGRRTTCRSNALKLGNRLLTGLRDLGADQPAVGDVRGKGLMAARRAGGAGRQPAGSGRGRAGRWRRPGARGLLVGKGGRYGNVLRIAPPLTLTEPEADEGLEHPAPTPSPPSARRPEAPPARPPPGARLEACSLSSSRPPTLRLLAPCCSPGSPHARAGPADGRRPDSLERVTAGPRARSEGRVSSTGLGGAWSARSPRWS